MHPTNRRPCGLTSLCLFRFCAIRNVASLGTGASTIQERRAASLASRLHYLPHPPGTVRGGGRGCEACACGRDCFPAAKCRRRAVGSTQGSLPAIFRLEKSVSEYHSAVSGAAFPG